MLFSTPLISGIFQKRYKRFMVDVQLTDGSVITAHCPNTGAMAGLLNAGNTVWLSKSNNIKRKLKHTWEISEIDGTYVGVNTQNPNRIIHQALIHKDIPPLKNYTTIQPELRYGRNNSIIDFLLTNDAGEKCYVEVKNAHYKTVYNNINIAVFPDSKTERGIKHLHELMHVIDQGHRAVMLYCVQRNDCTAFRFGHEFHTEYANIAKQAQTHGVEYLAYGCFVTPHDIHLNQQLLEIQ